MGIFSFVEDANAQVAQDSVNPSSLVFVRMNGGAYHRLDLRISNYADSINYMDSFPTFLFNRNFDIEEKWVWEVYLDRYGEEWILSLRKAIFKRVYNEAALQRIISSPDRRLDLTLSKKKVFYMDTSTRAMAKERLEEILHKKSELEKETK